MRSRLRRNVGENEGAIMSWRTQSNEGLQDFHIRVVAIGGSLRDNSYTTMALRAALDGAAEIATETRLLDLRDYALEFAGTDGLEPSPGILRLKREVRQAHGILLGTPEYHGSFSGVLKNAL